MSGCPMPALADIPVVGPWLASHPSISYVLGAFALLYWYVFVIRPSTYDFDNLPGPRSKSLIWGNLQEVIASPPGAKHTEWVDKYGKTFVYDFIFGAKRLCSTDPAFLAYVFGHSETFIKPVRTQGLLERLIGAGLLVAEHDVHRRQRRVLNPAFSTAALRDMMPVFFDKARELAAFLNTMIEEPGTDGAALTPDKPMDKVPGARRIDVMKFAGLATLDVIGVAGFDYDFQSLSHKENELADAFRVMFANFVPGPFAILQSLVPGMQYIPTKALRATRQSRQVMERIGKQLIENKKHAVRAQGEVEKDSDIGTDLLSLVIKANMASDLRPDQRMSDDEVLAQITTFMLAGNETSSTSLTWLLYRLAERPELQARLRAECQAVSGDPSLEELHALPLLDKCVHESLRFDAPVANTAREAIEDAVIPLAEPIKGRDGTLITELHVRKGTTIFIPLLSINRSPAVWGPDAGEFNPDRFDSPPKSQVPGVYGNTLTFLGGTRGCIGYRFALAEIKVMTFVLLRSLTFSLLPSNPKIQAATSIVMRPRIKGEWRIGPQMPLLVRPVE